jgi:hypothetical protein
VAKKSKKGEPVRLEAKRVGENRLGSESGEGSAGAA